MYYEDKPESDDQVQEFIEKIGLDAEEMGMDILAIKSFFWWLADYFSLEMDDDKLFAEICKFAGYLRECSKLGNPTDIMAALKRYFGLGMKAKQLYYPLQTRQIYSQN